MTAQMCKKWFVKFPPGDLSLDNATWLGRPVEIDRVQTETLAKNNQHYATWERANILKIFKSSVESHLHQLDYVHHVNVWIPHKLSEKTFLTIFLKVLLYLDVMKTFHFKNKLWQAMKSEYCTIMWNGRDHGQVKRTTSNCSKGQVPPKEGDVECLLGLEGNSLLSVPPGKPNN